MLELLNTFQAEAVEHVQTMNQCLLQLERGEKDPAMAGAAPPCRRRVSRSAAVGVVAGHSASRRGGRVSAQPKGRKTWLDRVVQSWLSLGASNRPSTRSESRTLELRRLRVPGRTGWIAIRVLEQPHPFWV